MQMDLNTDVDYDPHYENGGWTPLPAVCLAFLRALPVEQQCRGANFVNMTLKQVDSATCQWKWSVSCL